MPLACGSSALPSVLLALYNHARKVQVEQQGAHSEDDEISGIVFAELVMYVEEVRLEASTAPVFKLADMAQLYISRMQQFGLTSEKKDAHNSIEAETAHTFSCYASSK